MEQQPRRPEVRHPQVPEGAYTQQEWITETSVVFLLQNGYGHYWIKCRVKPTHGIEGAGWCSYYLREKPYKTLAGAIKAVATYGTK